LSASASGRCRDSALACDALGCCGSCETGGGDLAGSGLLRNSLAGGGNRLRREGLTGSARLEDALWRNGLSRSGNGRRRAVIRGCLSRYG